MATSSISGLLVFSTALTLAEAFNLGVKAPSLSLRLPRVEALSQTRAKVAFQSSSVSTIRPVQTPLAVNMAAATQTDCQCTIVGAGRIGLALADMGKAAGFQDMIVTRGGTIPADGTGPIYVCTRNDVLKTVIDACPSNRRGDLVFYGQNGYIEDFLRKEGLFGQVTQVLVYMAVAKKGDKPTDGITDLNPEGLTAATGKWAEQVAARLRGAGLTCNVFDEATFRASMYEKLMWISAFMLLGVHHGGITVGEVASSHKGDLTKMVQEMAAAISQEKGVSFKAGLPERLLAYARSVAHFPTALKEFEWRNKFFLDMTRAREAAGKPDLTPFHTQLLLKARVDGAVKFD